MAKAMPTLECNLCGETRQRVKFQSSTASRSGTAADFNVSTDYYGDFGRVVQCAACGLIYMDPRPDAASLSAAYADVSDDEYARESSSRSINAYFSLNTIGRFVPEGALLDVGCATGYFLNAARLRYSVRGVELSRDAVRFARESLGLDVLQGTLADARFPDASFDVVTLNDVIEHVADPRALLEEIHRVLKPNGLLYIVTPDIGSLTAQLLRTRWWGLRPAHIFYFSRPTLQALLRKTGFEPVHTRYYGRVFRCAYWLSRLRNYSQSFVRSIGRWIDWLGIEHKLVYLNTFDSIECCARKKAF